MVLLLPNVVHASAANQDWPSIHGGQSGWHFSALNEIHVGNVDRLKPSWVHDAETPTTELTGFPVVAGGYLAYCTDTDQIWVLEGATGKVKWHTRVAEAGESLVMANGGCRGLAIDQGVVYFAGAGGRVLALNLADGAIRWDIRVWPKGSRKGTLNGPPLVVRERLIVGTTPASNEHGELIGLNLRNGAEVWRLDFVGGPQQGHWNAKDSWIGGADSVTQPTLAAGVSASLPGAYDERSGTLYWGTGSPYPLFDPAGSSFKTHGIRPGDNLYSAGIMALDPVNGEIRFWHQEFPHETWVQDSAQTESFVIERKGQRYIVHPNRTGFVFVYSPDLKVLRIWQASKNINFVRAIDRASGTLKERRDFNAGEQKGLCPFVEGVFPGLSGAFSPKTGLMYKVAAEWCMDVSLNDRPSESAPSQSTVLGGKVTATAPPGERVRGHLDARDPLTGNKVWTVDFPEPPLASVLATAGDLVFVADGRGTLQAFHAGTGRKLWSDTQPEGYAGGVISYEAAGHQYIALISGWDSRRHPAYAKLFGGPYDQERPVQARIRTYRLPPIR